MLSKELGTKLTGRHIALTMYPYSFYEYVNSTSPELLGKSCYVTEDIAMARRAFANYCRVGGIPEFVRLEQTDYLHGLYEGVIYRDIITRYKLTQEKPIKELVFYLASHVGKEITYNSLRKIIGLSNAATVGEYFEYLENSFLCFLVNRYSHSLKKQIGYEKKQYFIDHALAGAVGFRTSDDRGRFLENIIFIELKRRNKDIYFHKERNECDFVIKYKNKIEEVIQVCIHLESVDIKKRVYGGLIEAMRAYGLQSGIILTEGAEYNETFIFEGIEYNIKVLAVWKWLLNYASYPN